MTIDTTEETYADTRQGRQAKAALAIAKMSEHQLPEIAHWMIRHDLSVSGSIRSYIDPFGALREWAAFLAPRQGEPLQPQFTPPPEDSGTWRVSVHGTYRDVPVEIYFLALDSDAAEIRVRAGSEANAR